MKPKKTFLSFAVCTLLASGIFAQDWPQFLGPDRNSKSPETGLLRSWPEEGPEVLWTVDLGIGYGGPVVKDGKVYLLDREKGTSDIMRCFDLDTMIYADGLILATDGAKKLYLIEPGPAGFKPLASAELLGEPKEGAEGIVARVGGSTQNWAPIALSKGKLLIRDQNRMMCVKVAE